MFEQLHLLLSKNNNNAFKTLKLSGVACYILFLLFFACMKLIFNNPFRTLLKHDGKEMGGRPAQVGEALPKRTILFNLLKILET